MSPVILSICKPLSHTLPAPAGSKSGDATSPEAPPQQSQGRQKSMRAWPILASVTGAGGLLALIPLMPVVFIAFVLVLPAFLPVVLLLLLFAAPSGSFLLRTDQKDDEKRSELSARAVQEG